MQNYENPWTALDVGIGQGGLYLANSAEKNRVGVDLEVDDLSICKLKYGRPNLQLVKVDAFSSLPFKDGTFSEINMYFPYALFTGLIDPELGLWPEISRVAADKSTINVIYDTFGERKRIFVGRDKPYYVFKPDSKIKRVGELFGFRFSATEITPAAAHDALATEFSGKIHQMSLRRNKIKIHHLQGTRG